MTEQLPDTRAPRTAAEIEAYTIGGARPLNGPVHLTDYDAAWPELFAREAARILQILGPAAKRIEHVGSTSVPGLAAKPIIDIVMEVADSGDESSYVAPLEAHGYQLRIREPEWYEHRVLKGPDTDINLHVFTLGCIEIPRMTRFRDHLRTNSADRAVVRGN